MTPTLVDLLSDKLEGAFKKAFPGEALPAPIEVVASTQPQFGHYQCNSAMKYAKELKTSPRAIAEALSSRLDGGDLVEKVEIAGPGFINIWIDPASASNRLNAALHDPRLGLPLPKHPQKIIVEFSSPNLAKELHVGHIRSTIIGDCLARLFEFLGHDVLRLNHVGDWGTQFGMLISFIKEQHPDVFEGRSEPELFMLQQWYKAAKIRFDNDPDFKQRSQLEVVRLQNGDPASKKAWEIIRDISRKGYQEIYDLLDIDLLERGESFYNPHLKGIIDDLERKQLLTVSDGAKCLFLDEFKNRDGNPLPIILQKSDGGFNYATTDMAALRHRIDVEKADRIIVVVDAGQSLHFQMIIKGAQLAGYFDPNKSRFDHVAFGVVLGPDGKKFKTRSGDTEKLIDLLRAAIDYARKLLTERQLDLPEEELEHLATVLGIDAIKYADLSCLRTSDYVFSYEKMLRFEGNTAAFMLYAYVRMASIKRKVDISIEDAAKTNRIDLQHPSEIALGMHLMRFREVLEQMAKDLLPNRLAEYLFELAEKFNAFFRDCRVEGSTQQNARLLLCEIASRTLKQGLEILGLRTVERM